LSFALGAGISSSLIGNQDFNNFVKPASSNVATEYAELPRTPPPVKRSMTLKQQADLILKKTLLVYLFLRLE
jgi:hypothetical protein